MNVSRLTVLLLLCLAVSVVFMHIYSAQSAPATPVSAQAPQPSTQTVTAGDTANQITYVAASGGSGNYNYQWFEETPGGSFVSAQNCGTGTTTSPTPCIFAT